MNERTIKRELIYKGKIVTLEKHTVQLDNGIKSLREIVRHKGASGILPIDEEENVYLVRQFRKAYEQEILEIPAGVLEEGETAQECAMRELREELQFSSEVLTFLGSFYPSPGYLDEEVYLYLAKGLSYAEGSLDEDEMINSVKMPVKKLYEKILSGEVKDGKTIMAVQFYMTKFN